MLAIDRPTFADPMNVPRVLRNRAAKMLTMELTVAKVTVSPTLFLSVPSNPIPK